MVRQQGMMGAGVLLGLVVLAVAGRADEATGVKAVEKMGGMVTRGTWLPGRPVVRVDLNHAKITDTGLKELKELTSLRGLDLNRTKITDTNLKHLKELKSLVYLNL